MGAKARCMSRLLIFVNGDGREIDAALLDLSASDYDFDICPCEVFFDLPANRVLALA
jgi:hypothetical protein